MKTYLSFSLLAAGCATLALSSCMMPLDDYSSGGYDGSYSSGYSAPRPSYSGGSSVFYDNDYSYYDGGYSPYWTQPRSYYSVGYSYYRGNGSCPICRHSPCSGHHGRPSSYSSYSNSHRDYDNHSHSSYSQPSYVHRDNDNHSHSSGGGNSSRSQPLYIHNGGGGGAQGAHTKEWFEQRGYAPSRLQKVDDDHSSSHKNDDDDKKHHR